MIPGPKAELTRDSGPALPGDSPGHPMPGTGVGESILRLFGKRTCITGTRGLGQIRLPTVVAWGGQAAIQARVSGSGL